MLYALLRRPFRAQRTRLTYTPYQSRKTRRLMWKEMYLMNGVNAAIALERPHLFEALVCFGARLDDDVARLCVEKARSEGLESMLDLLVGYGMDVEEVLKECEK
jgi:hypothetical protein